MDYINTFLEKFGDVLVKHSPEFWKLLMFDLLEKIEKSKNKPNEDLFNELNVVLPG